MCVCVCVVFKGAVAEMIERVVLARPFHVT